VASTTACGNSRWSHRHSVDQVPRPEERFLLLGRVQIHPGRKLIVCQRRQLRIRVWSGQVGEEHLLEGRWGSSLGSTGIARGHGGRTIHAIAARYEQHRDAIDAAIRETETVPDAAVVVRVGMAGVMVPQDGEYAKPRGRKTGTPAEPRHERRPNESASPAEEDGQSGLAWHEATVGTLSYWDEDGNLPSTEVDALLS
jgi:hypothetical protein